MFFVQYLVFFIPDTESPVHYKKYLEIEIRPRTLVRLGTKTERKSNTEKPARLLYVTYVVIEFHSLFYIVKTLFQDEEKSGQ